MKYLATAGEPEVKPTESLSFRARETNGKAEHFKDSYDKKLQSIVCFLL